MKQVLPINLNYNDIKPVGYPSKIKQQKYTPVAFNTSNNGVSSGDVIRFNISDNGFWDPYSAYIKLEVNVSGMDGTKIAAANTPGAAGSLQVDNSASSFISQLVIYDKGSEIERIEEYDTLCAILNDMNSCDFNRYSRSFEGLGFTQAQTGQQYSNVRISNGTSGVLGYAPQANYSPGQANTTQISAATMSGAGGISVNRYENVLLNEDSKNTIQKTTSGNFFNGYYLPLNTPQVYGYALPFNPSLCSSSNEPLLSKNIQQYVTYKGNLATAIYCDTQTFCIPILSGLLGILMPKESYKYIPMKALQELILEFRLNPFAMFTSGYADGATITNSGANALLPLRTAVNPMLSRIWRITKFEINVEMQYFEPQVESIILSQLNSETGIIIHSQSWLYGPRYTMTANTGPSGNYSVNLGFESMKNVVFVFLPDDFQEYTFCRKQYRISANVTQFYIKIGTQYYPPLPITGHAGNPFGYNSITNDTDLNNSEFMVMLYKAFGKFQDVSTACSVNSVNFAINQRPYDPTKTTAYSDGTNITNLDTALSAPLFHENRCVGKAIYGMNLETLNQDFSVISGINTINNRPFEIVLKSDNTNAYPRSSNMYIFCNFDMLIQLRLTGVQVLGRG